METKILDCSTPQAFAYAVGKLASILKGSVAEKLWHFSSMQDVELVEPKNVMGYPSMEVDLFRGSTNETKGASTLSLVLSKSKRTDLLISAQKVVFDLRVTRIRVESNGTSVIISFIFDGRLADSRFGPLRYLDREVMLAQLTCLQMRDDFRLPV